MKDEELNFKALSFMIFFVVDDIKIVSLYYYEFPSKKKKKSLLFVLDRLGF